MSDWDWDDDDDWRPGEKDCPCDEERGYSHACPEHGWQGDPPVGTEWLGEYPDAEG